MMSKLPLIGSKYNVVIYILCAHSYAAMVQLHKKHTLYIYKISYQICHFIDRSSMLSQRADFHFAVGNVSFLTQG